MTRETWDDLLEAMFAALAKRPVSSGQGTLPVSVIVGLHDATRSFTPWRPSPGSRVVSLSEDLRVEGTDRAA